MKHYFLLFAFALVNFTAHTQRPVSRPYLCRIVEVHDGDTVTLDTFLGKGIWEHATPHRLFGIDTAELSTEQGVTIGTCVKEMLTPDDICYIVVLQTKDGRDLKDKYGRWLAIVYDKYGNNVNDFLIRNNLAKPYFGGKKN